MRLKTDELTPLIKNLMLFYLPIEIDFHDKDKPAFNEAILDYVSKNKKD